MIDADSGSRRPGPRSDVDVRDLILDTAEAMVGDSSPDAVSMRAVARGAGVAPRAVVHHFPTKDALLDAIILRRGVGSNASVKQNLLALTTADEPPSIRDVVSAVLSPILDVINADPVPGVRWLRVFSARSRALGLAWTLSMSADAELPVLVYELAEQSLADAEPGAMTRFPIAMSQMVDTLGRADLI